jgi:hypothetical protein
MEVSGEDEDLFIILKKHINVSFFYFLGTPGSLNIDTESR